MPFGLSNAPSVFQAFIQDTLRDFLGVFCVVYLDDILIFSRNQAEPDRVSKGKGRASNEDDSDMDVDSDALGSGRVIAPHGSHLKVLQSFKNIGPINDALLVDLERTGQVSSSSSRAYNN